MHKIQIDVQPVTWKAHGGYGRRSFNPRQLEKDYYQHCIKRQFSSNNPIKGAVIIKYTFLLPIAASTPKKLRKEILEGKAHHLKRIDCSNLVKFAEDTLKGIVIEDDCQVVRFTAHKKYDENPRTIILIKEIL